MTEKSAEVKRRAKKGKTGQTYMQQVKPVFKRLLGQLELVLLGGMDDEEDVRHEIEWTSADCFAIVRLFVNNQKEFARCMMEAASRDEVVGRIMNMQWAWDRRKIKHDTEERSLQEMGQSVFNAI